uniref:Uncharacterized protein n=1 Tax=Oryza rufipogon TaxID=4529 RepID=A0A0E0QX61_ORYRU
MWLWPAKVFGWRIEVQLAGEGEQGDGWRRRLWPAKVLSRRSWLSRWPEKLLAGGVLVVMVDGRWYCRLERSSLGWSVGR